jgi:hypothetical protein
MDATSSNYEHVRLTEQHLRDGRRLAVATASDEAALDRVTGSSAMPEPTSLGSGGTSRSSALTTVGAVNHERPRRPRVRGDSVGRRDRCGA